MFGKKKKTSKTSSTTRKTKTTPAKKRSTSKSAAKTARSRAKTATAASKVRRANNLRRKANNSARTAQRLANIRRGNRQGLARLRAVRSPRGIYFAVFVVFGPGIGTLAGRIDFRSGLINHRRQYRGALTVLEHIPARGCYDHLDGIGVVDERGNVHELAVVGVRC